MKDVHVQMAIVSFVAGCFPACFSHTAEPGTKQDKRTQALVSHTFYIGCSTFPVCNHKSSSPLSIPIWRLYQQPSGRGRRNLSPQPQSSISHCCRYTELCISRRLEANSTCRTIERLDQDPSATAWNWRQTHIVCIVSK